VRGAALGLQKWSASNDECAVEAATKVANLSVVALALRIHKHPERWDSFWSNAEQYYIRASTFGAKRAGFLKAANLIRYWLFGECSARLAGECLRQLGLPTVFDGQRRRRFDLRVVCDADIQGRENTAMFDYLWQRLEREQPLFRKHGLSETAHAELRSEEQEPGLLLADHLAGCVQAFSAGTSAPRPAGISERGAVAVEAVYRDAPNVVIVERGFDLDYREILGDTELGRLLWPDI
jgi:hypothetical protein